MNIRMVREETPVSINAGRWDVGLIGSAIDPRGKAASEFLRGRSRTMFSISYSPADRVLALGGTPISDKAFVEKIGRTSGRIVLEATTLGFVEIALLSRILRDASFKNIDLLYLEPRYYRLPAPSDVLLARDFALTDQVSLYSGLPGRTFQIEEDRSRIVFFLGFEGERLTQAIEQLHFNPEHCSVVFGVPAYRPGWEVNAFANNIHIMKDAKFAGGVEFCGADNPLSVITYLSSFHSCHSQDEQVFVVPIGTKPHGIGAALFAAETPTVGIFYDNPTRSAGRTTELGNWHLFEVAF